MSTWKYSVFVTLVLLVIFSICEKQMDNEEDEDEDEDSPNLQSCVNKNISVSRVLNVGENKTVWVIDNSLPQCSFQPWWSSIQHKYSVDGYDYNHLNFSKEDHKSRLKYGSSPWSKHVSLENLRKIPSWLKLTETLELLLKKKIKVLEAKNEVLRAMDAMAPGFKRNCSPDHYTLTIFVNNMWNLNDYAQVSFYEVPSNHVHGKKKMWEISETVHPHPYRAILWPSCQAMMLRSPCINRYNHFQTLSIQLTTNLEDETTKVETNPDSNKNKNFIQFKLSPSKHEIDYNRHLTRTFNDGDPSRRVLIFDDLFTTDDLRRWLHVLLQESPHVNDFDPHLLEDHDNVQWIASYKVKDFIQSGMWPRLMALCEFVSNHTGWFPYDVAMNHVRFADHTRIHPDSETHQDELTMVLYLNEDLSATDYGETTFYVPRSDDGVHGFTGEGGNLYEAIGSVAPKFGRIAIFTNNIEHSAHPPSSKYLGCRYTFAVKVSKTQRLAMIKMVYEGMEALDLNQKMQKLKRQLETGELDAEKTYPLADLEKMWKKIEKNKATMYDDALNRIERL